MTTLIQTSRFTVSLLDADAGVARVGIVWPDEAAASTIPSDEAVATALRAALGNEWVMVGDWDGVNEGAIEVVGRWESCTQDLLDRRAPGLNPDIREAAHAAFDGDTAAQWASIYLLRLADFLREEAIAEGAAWPPSDWLPGHWENLEEEARLLRVELDGVALWSRYAAPAPATRPGAVIESLDDAEGYRALGESNRTPGASDDETLQWAMDATRARVADTATEADHQRILRWVREGEARAAG
jgi:hypothetical protein